MQLNWDICKVFCFYLLHDCYKSDDKCVSKLNFLFCYFKSNAYFHAGWMMELLFVSIQAVTGRWKGTRIL